MSDKQISTASIILPVLNEAEHIERCVRSLMNNRYDRDKVEILVVDGGSTDNTLQIVNKLSEEDKRVRLINNPRRILAAGINIGIETSRGDVLIRMDGHAEAESDFIANSIEVLREHPEAWCVGGAITTISHDYMGRVIGATMSCLVGVGNAMFRLGDYEGYADTVAFGAYRKEIFEKIGKLDENLPRTEDDDLHFRIHQAGGKIYISRKIRSKYYARSSIAKLWSQYFQYGYWRIPTIMKHHRPATVRQIVPMIFIMGWIVFILGALIWQPVRYGLAFYAVSYIIVLLVGAALATKKFGFSAGIATPIVSPILHFSYGLGSLVGIWRFVIRQGKRAKPVSQTKITR
jgi:glycosyltransferase involved in cell wall biosynthesis